MERYVLITDEAVTVGIPLTRPARGVPGWERAPAQERASACTFSRSAWIRSGGSVAAVRAASP